MHIQDIYVLMFELFGLAKEQVPVESTYRRVDQGRSNQRIFSTPMRERSLWVHACYSDASKHLCPAMRRGMRSL